MIKWQHLAALLPLALLWWWILQRSAEATFGAWLLLAVPVLVWLALDWLGSGSSLGGPNPKPQAEERFFCYLFMGVGMLPLMAAASGVMALERFKPGFLPTLFGDAFEVAAFCVLGLIATPVVRLLGWSDALFGRPPHSSAGGGGP